MRVRAKYSDCRFGLSEATIGIDFLSKTMYLEAVPDCFGERVCWNCEGHKLQDRTVRLQLWDTAGQARVKRLRIKAMPVLALADSGIEGTLSQLDSQLHPRFFRCHCRADPNV